jgi:hypothetical protein
VKGMKMRTSVVGEARDGVRKTWILTQRNFLNYARNPVAFGILSASDPSWCVSIFDIMFERNEIVPRGTIGPANIASSVTRPSDALSVLIKMRLSHRNSTPCTRQLFGTNTRSR